MDRVGEDATKTPDFSLDRGAIRVSNRGSQILEGLFALIKSAMPYIDTAFGVLDKSELQGFLASGEDTRVGSYIHYCLACSYDCARRVYGNDEASLMVDALFARCFKGALPKHELYQEYIAFPLFPEERRRSAESSKRAKAWWEELFPGEGRRSVEFGEPPEPLRTWRFVQDVTGDLRAGPILLLDLVATQFVLDGHDIIRADQPAVAGQQVADGFGDRVGEILAKIRRPPNSEEGE